jgi:hypothetical protein
MIPIKMRRTRIWKTTRGGYEYIDEDDNEEDDGEDVMDTKDDEGGHDEDITVECRCPRLLSQQLDRLKRLIKTPDHPQVQSVFKSYTIHQISTFCRDHLRLSVQILWGCATVPPTKNSIIEC